MRWGKVLYTVNFNKAGFILGCENINWDRYDFKALFKLVKSFILLIWDTRKEKLYVASYPGGCGLDTRLNYMVIRIDSVISLVTLALVRGLTSSTCVCGCVVNGVNTTAATQFLYFSGRSAMEVASEVVATVTDPHAMVGPEVRAHCSIL